MIEFGPVRGNNVARGYSRPSADAEASADRKGSACRDLVAVSPVKRRDSGRQTPGTGSSAAFLAHLIATAEHFPQTREKRRLAPQEASRLYNAAQASVQPRRTRLGSL